MAGKSDVYQRRMDEFTEVVAPFLNKEEVLKLMTPEEILRGLDTEALEKLKQLLNNGGGVEND